MSRVFHFAVRHCFLLMFANAIALYAVQSLASAVSDAERVVSRQDTITVEGQVLDYTAAAGKLLIRDPDGTPEAEIFYVAYTLKGEPPDSRPVTFIWDGGPGGATFAANYFGLGPKRFFPSHHKRPGAPYEAEANPYSLLKHTDLVFLDPIGTGYSRAVGDKPEKEFWSVEGDAQSIVAAIQRYLSLNKRWQSPKFLLGTSYGTTRASVVSHKLQLDGVALNGVILFGSALNFGMFDNGMDQQFMLSLPTMAATAWHFGKTAYSSLSLPEFLKEVQTFIRTDYGPALFQGNALPVEEKRRLAKQLSRYIGLDPQYIFDAHLRVSVIRFRKELLRERGLVVGRMDGRTTMADFDTVGEEPESDYWVHESFAMPARAIIEDFLGGELGFETEQHYNLGSAGAAKYWQWHHPLPPVAGVSQREFDERNLFPQNTWAAADLSVAMRTNSKLRVFQGHGYFDFATPYAWGDYDLAHMSYDPQLMKRITTAYYKAGHVIYYDEKELPRIYADLTRFYLAALGKEAQSESIETVGAQR